jgi:hypothetical protein
MCETKVVEKIKTQFYVQNSLYCAINEVMCKNTAVQGRPQVTIWCMCIACWVPKARDTYLLIAIITDFPLEQWLFKRASFLPYTYVACLVTPEMMDSVQNFSHDCD